ncbi:hypothetical protein [Pseudomonas pharyngis]|uniref:hypothetical protein n=1 Tax=Pseudomonas pharyngis TaxID=2892333 RepID=UPI003FD32C99
MKLPAEALSFQDKMNEFDSWLTPQLHELKGTEKFRVELSNIGFMIESLAEKLNNFSSIEDCALPSVRDAVLEIIHERLNNSWGNTHEIESMGWFLSFFSLLFLVTAATDNNLKNHFTIKLKQDGVPAEFPEKVGRQNISFRMKPFGNTVTSKEMAVKLARALVGSRDYKINQDALINNNIDLAQSVFTMLFEYITLVMVDRGDVIQFWAICKAYMDCKATSIEAAYSLLTPAVIFKIRGSVSATAGHLPENILREKLTLLGLEPGRDFNTSDVIIGHESVLEDGELRDKTRAYDFVLPYRREGWQSKLFIQSQFYAGDSGSVSHKVVDQTKSSRVYTENIHAGARFVEYLDGAGYYAALRGDLVHMMKMTNTHSFIQVRSLWVRLRRELQLIGFITPVEIEHAIMRTADGNLDLVKKILLEEGYDELEIHRSISFALSKGFIFEHQGCFSISNDRKALARRLFIIDTVARIGGVLVSPAELAMSISIPGYGASFGVGYPVLARSVEQQLRYEPVSISDYSLDMEWLLEEKVIKRPG